MGKGKKRGAGPSEDQFGEIGGSQDRQDHHHGGGRGGGGRGGGTAGGGRGGSHSDLTFQRHVPKFLQSHAHLLGSGQQDQQNHVDSSTLDDFDGDKKRKMTADGGGGDASDFEDDEEAALRRALEENPALADVHPELGQIADKMRAGELKEQGNAFFISGKYEEAAESFSQCIKIDPGNEVYWSNRAASYINLKRYVDAERDARKVVALKPTWVKGWARLGAALLAQEDGCEAREALERAVALEPNNTTIQTQLSKAMALEAKEVASGQHKFKRRKEEAIHKQGKKEGAAHTRESAVVAGHVAESLGGAKKKQLLSFEDDEEEENE